MDPDSLQKLLAQLMSQPHFAKLLKGIAGQESGQVHFIFGDGTASSDDDKVRTLLEMISQHAESVGDLTELTDPDNTSQIGMHMVALLLQMGEKLQADSDRSGDARTLRESIDRESPW